MIIDFLNELKSEYLEKKYDLESQKNCLNIKLEENNKFIQRLNNESEQNFNAFSPRAQNDKFKSKINDLEKERQALVNQLNEVNSDLESLNLKLKQLEIVLKSVKKEKASEVKYKFDPDMIQKIESAIHKLELSSKIILTDYFRCKTELSNANKILYEILSEMEEYLS